MKKIRIAHIAGGLTSGGVEAVIYNYFSNMDLSDYELVYISYTEPNPEVRKKFEAIGFTVYRVTEKKVNFFKSVREVAYIFKKHHINVVHSHMTLMCFVTSIIGMLCGIKIRIMHSHLALSTKGVKRVPYFLFKVASRITATDWFACGREAAVYMYGKEALQAGKVKILNNAVEIDKYRYNKSVRDEIRKKYGIEDKICIGHVGRFIEQKNHFFLLDIYKELLLTNSNMVLLCVGEGVLESAVKEKAKKENLQDAIIFMGSCNNVNELYQAMDMLLFPSLYEGLPLVLVEAQTAGLECFVSDMVTKEIQLSEKVHYLSLGKSAVEWAEYIQNHISSTGRNDVVKVIVEKGYSIEKEVKVLDQFYRKRVGCV